MECFHCGDNSGEHAIVFDEKSFCCNGCKTVYELLSTNNLSSYYTLESKPGIRPSKSEEHQFDFLDNEEIAAPLFQFKEGDTAIVILFLPDIHCSSCIWLLENLNQLEPGVHHSEVNFIQKTATITFDTSKISLKELAVMLFRIGYKPEFRTKTEESVGTSKKLLIQLGVAGFCFGNIMLLSFPEYLGTNHEVALEFQKYFQLLILLLSLPVLLYAASDYLISAFKAIRSKTINLDVPISIGIVVLYAKSTSDMLLGNGPGYMDSFAGFVFFLLIGKWFQQKTWQSLSFERDYRSYFPLAVKRVNHNEEEIVAIKDLDVGDEILLRNNEILPVDGILLGEESQLDYSFVTGETKKVRKRKGELIFAGARHIGAAVKVKATKTVELSYLTSLWNNKAFSQHKQNPLEEWSNKLSRYFIWTVLSVSTLMSGIWLLIDPSASINVLISVLIVACPCALALSVPFTYGNAIRILAREQLFLKNAQTVYSFSNITDIVFDKTGTITDKSKANLSFIGSELSTDELNLVLNITRCSTHPLSEQISHYLTDSIDFQTRAISDFKEHAGKGIEGTINGKLIRIGSSDYVGTSAIDDGTTVHVSLGGIYKGYFCLSNVYREGFEEMIGLLKDRFNLHVLTGDNESEKQRLLAFFETENQLRFNQQPEEKLNYIKALQEQGKTVLMIGDGLNDAGALKQSDVGITVAEDIHSFSPSCDGIMGATALKKVPYFTRFAKKSGQVLRWALILSIIYNTAGLYFAATNQLSPLIAAILMPLSSISIVFFTTIAVRVNAKNINKSEGYK